MFNCHHLAKNIKKYRKVKGISQGILADMLGVSPQSVSKWECGISVPDVENLCLLSELLSVPLDILLEHCSENKKIMIGIDGGGTKTLFMLFTEDGKILDTAKLEACNPNTVGISASIDVLRNGIDKLMQTNPNIHGIYIGAAGFLLGNNVKIIMEALKKSYPHAKIGSSSDMLNISASALEDDTNCISAICGTGSSVLIKQGTNLRRLSGYGYRISKAGSGYDMGREALYAALCEIDGMGEKTALTPLIKSRLGENVSDIIDKVYKNDAAFTASLAQLVLEAYRKGDAVAERIVKENAKALADTVNAAYESNTSITSAVVSGGIVTQNKDFAKLVLEHINPRIKVTIPDTEPVLGACVLCAKMCNVNTENLLSRLKEAYGKER